MTDYQPTPADLRWAQSVTGSIKNGGLWIYPAANQTYRFDHTKKVITLETSPDTPDHTEQFERTQVVFGRLGYTVVDGRDTFIANQN